MFAVCVPGLVRRNCVVERSDCSTAVTIHGPMEAGGAAGSASKYVPSLRIWAPTTCAPAASARTQPSLLASPAKAPGADFTYCCEAGMETAAGAEPDTLPSEPKPRSEVARGAAPKFTRLSMDDEVASENARVVLEKGPGMASV